MRLWFRCCGQEVDADIVQLRFEYEGAQPEWCLFGHDYTDGRDGSEMRSWRLRDVVVPEYVSGLWHRTFPLITLPMDPHRSPGI